MDRETRCHNAYNVIRDELCGYAFSKSIFASESVKKAERNMDEKWTLYVKAVIPWEEFELALKEYREVFPV